MHFTSHRHARRPILAAAIAATAALALSACAPGAPESTAERESATPSAGERLALTYEGGLLVLDAETLDVLADLPLDGFNRLNAAGDGEHVFVSTDSGCRVLATGADGSEPELTDLAFEAQTPSHVVRHDGRTLLFDNGTGTITAFDTDALGDATEIPATVTVESEQAHHGVAVELSDGTVVSTLGDSETGVGARCSTPKASRSTGSSSAPPCTARESQPTRP